MFVITRITFSTIDLCRDEYYVNACRYIIYRVNREARKSVAKLYSSMNMCTVKFI